MDLLDRLFSTPSPAPSVLSPLRWPGASPESTASLLRNLKENHIKYHIYFNEIEFHNHLSHHLLAIWALGATSPVIDAAHHSHVAYQRPAFPSPERITDDNFHKNLGNESFYQAYLEYFTSILLQKDVSATLEEHVFSNKANFDLTRGDQEQGEMLNRLMEGLVHPLIHIGYGLEFGLLGQIAQGLAQAAVHSASSGALLPPDFFDDDTSVTQLANDLPSLSLSFKPTNDTHVFTIVARILKDPQFAPKGPGDPIRAYIETVASLGEAIRSYAAEWQVDGANKADVANKIEQLVWMNAVLYGVGGWKTGRPFKHNFFLMHLVTSSLFLSSWTAYLSPRSISRLLHTYFTVSLAWWISRGRPPLDIRSFFAEPTTYPSSPGPHPTPSETTFPAPTHPDALTPNSWLPIIQTALVHENEHLCKLQRSLAHYAVLYGTRTAGGADFASTELEGAELLDGTLFIRIAGLTADKMGWVREGEGVKNWDRIVYFNE